jgi:Xaa-Pro aminopeptidase
VDTTRLKDLLQERDLSAIIAGSTNNFAYFTGTRIQTTVDIPDRTAFATFLRDGTMLATVCTVEAGQLAGRVSAIAEYTEFEQVPHQVLARQLLDAGVSGSVGFESTWMPAATRDELQAALGDRIRLVAADDLYGKVWAVKTPEQIAHLERGARATIEAIKNSFTPGHDTEIAVAQDLAAGILSGGAEEIPFMILSSGRRSLIGHPYPTHARLEDGTTIRCDVGGRFDCFLSDLARTGVIGHGRQEIFDNYAKVADIHAKVLESIRPGRPANWFMQLTADLYARAGLPFRPHLVGHNIGIQVHEWPILNVVETAPLESGMVLCIEHGYTGSDYKLHIENTGVVTPDGFRLFTDSCPWDRPLSL